MSIFDEISKLRKSGKEPYQWYRNRIKELGTPSQAQLIRDGKITCLLYTSPSPRD